MKLSEIKKELNSLTTIAFQLPNGELVPNHFHVTEVGKVTNILTIVAERFVMKKSLISNCGRPMIMTIVYIRKNWFTLLSFPKKFWIWPIWKLKLNIK